jgi:hypothetical protein
MPSILRFTAVAGTLAVLVASPSFARAQDNDAELAKKLNNPVSSLISVPLQLNYDCCFGPDEGERYTLNIQPVMPFKLSDNWNLIVRTILPVTYQAETSPQAGDASGLGDITQSFFFSPPSSAGGVTWAVGPAFLWPTGESELGTKKWGAGPTVLILKQTQGWTYGMLANHIWSYADLGDNDRGDVSSTFVQPFVSWTNTQHTTVGLNAESSYNWQTRAWTIPVNMTVSHLYKFGDQRVQLAGGIRFYAAREDFGPDWGLRFTTTFLFPR